MIRPYRAWVSSYKIMCPVLSINFQKEELSVDAGESYQYIFAFSECVVMQSTGLKDKNGVEIFEGDVLRHPKSGEYFSIQWDAVMCAYRAFYPDTQNCGAIHLQITKGDAVVVGNIHANHELMAVRGE